MSIVASSYFLHFLSALWPHLGAVATTFPSDCKEALTGGSKWVGPSRAQVGGPKPGPSWAQARNLGPKKIQKIKILKIKICVAQNVDKVWISRKNQLLAPFGAISGKFFHGPENAKNCKTIAYFPWRAQWALFTRFGVI